MFTQLGGVLEFAIAVNAARTAATMPQPVRARCSPRGSRRRPFGRWPRLAKVPRCAIELLRSGSGVLVRHKAGRDLYSAAYDTVQAAYSLAARQGAGLKIQIS